MKGKLATLAAAALVSYGAQAANELKIGFLSTLSGPASARRKQLPSSNISVVTRQGAPGVRRNAAVSSPRPINTRGSAGVRRRSQSM